MDQQQRQLIKKYLDLILRRKKIIITFFLISIVVGLGVYLRTPKIFQCNSLIKYQRQSVNPTKMSPDDVRSRTRDVVSTISQQITSRTSLEQIIKDFDLYSGARRELPMEDVVEMMRDKHIEITPGKKGDIFEVSYQGADPRKVLRVTNALAAKFIEENLRYRGERASATSAYVKDELSMAKETIDRKEALMRDYKLKYYNEMPDQRQTNMNRLNALQEQLQNAQDSVQDLDRTRILIQEQVSLRKEMLAQAARYAGLGETGELTPQSEDSVRAILQELLSRYTEKHPEVRRLRKRLEKLEQDIASEEGEQAASVSPARHGDLQLEQLQVQLKEIDYQIKRLKEDRVTIQTQIDQYLQWIENGAVREAEWAALSRDYQQLHEHYQALVARNLEAESAEYLEKSQRGSQFKIIDPAHFPEKPFKPDFRKIMLMALALGLGVGGGLAFGLELLDTSFKDPEELENVLGLPVACAIPLINTPDELKRKKIMMIIWTVAFLISSMVVLGLLVYCWQKGLIIL
ncbi:MAG: hypothetical protein J7L69_02175 [Desulfobulbaceae bacterium]|nr:hypothetical protein [Desulfobulbaceae bacterium]